MLLITLVLAVFFCLLVQVPAVHCIRVCGDLKHTEDLIIMLGLAFVYFKTITKRKQPRRIWVNSYLKERRTKGRYYRDFADLRSNPSLFRENFHMSPSQFDKLLTLLKDELCPKPKSRNSDNISAEEKLCITLEFLASGTLQRHIASVYRISKQRVGPIIEHTCELIFKALKSGHMSELTRAKWIDVANEFHCRWNFPNCLGAIDGKHIAIKCPDKANSLFYNYKGFHSIVLMAVSDASYKFIYVDIGAYGSEGDSTVFRKSEFGRSLAQGKLQLPKSLPVNGLETPYLFLADDAFPLTPRIMKPFKPKKGVSLNKEESVFNYRLSRARRCVENSFGILCARWICLARTLFMNPTRAQKVVAACCLLHNWLMEDSPGGYCPPGFADTENPDGSITPGHWRDAIPNNSMFNSEFCTQNTGRPTNNATQIRESLKTYFSSPIGKLDWQDKNIYCVNSSTQ